MKILRAVLLLVACVGVFYGANNSFGLVPPLGKFLDPFAGFWQNGRAQDVVPEVLTISGLQHEVNVVWDDRQIPHIFADNSMDLYLAQGYLTARARLWQMDFTKRVTAGRLSELFGSRMIDFDRFYRRIGMVSGAEVALEVMMDDPESGPAVNAYCKGVNAFINELDYKNLPVEYKILGYEPEEYTPMDVALLLKSFQYQLAFHGNDASLTRTKAVFGPGTMDLLYPLLPAISEPVIPEGETWDFEPIEVAQPPLPGGPGPPPGPSLGVRDNNRDTGEPMLSSPRRSDRPMEAPAIGSNNWVVSGSRTQSGVPLLANDPHLSLTLPSVWYECQLSAPGLNVYGVIPPGAPGIIFGFNEKIAWGITNAQTDVLDWYEIKFTDSTNSAYYYDGQPRPTRLRVEEIHVKGGETVYDSVIYTHYGPVCYLKGEAPFDDDVPPGCAMRWTGLEPSNEMRAILSLNYAADYDEFRASLSELSCPQLNFVYADLEGDIGIVHNGRFPLRWLDQGSTIMDGSLSGYEWQGWIPNAHIPDIRNPVRGYLSSANQHPTDSDYPYWLGWNWISVDRASRINERLEELTAATLDDMMDLQNDVHNYHARHVLPTMLSVIDRDILSESERVAFDEISAWDYEHSADAIPPRLFTYWWWWLNHELWDDDMDTPQGSLAWPSRDVTEQILLSAVLSPFWDNINTEEPESRSDIVIEAFISAFDQLTSDFGPYGTAWTVSESRGTTIRHLARVPGFGSGKLATGGTKTTVNATQAHYGPTWRMIVSLERPIRAWGVIAGGQSGHPGSQFYDIDLKDWVNGSYREFLFLQSAHDDRDRLISRTRLEPQS